MDCCQSCGLPFDEDHRSRGLVAKEADGSDSMYCIYCYKDGEFINPNATAQDMIEIGVSLLAPRMGEQAAREELSYIPALKRWRS